MKTLCQRDTEREFGFKVHCENFWIRFGISSEDAPTNLQSEIRNKASKYFVQIELLWILHFWYSTDPDLKNH